MIRMAYITVADVRAFLSVQSDVVSDADITTFITTAQKQVIRDISALAVNDTLTDPDGTTANINDSNTKFKVKNTPIADTDADEDIDTGDITVYGWTDYDDPTTKVVLAVTSVNAETGVITFTTAPSSSYEMITADYRYYMNRVDWDLVELASIYKVGWHIAVREFDLLPDTVRLGDMQYIGRGDSTGSGRASYKMKLAYDSVLRLITGGIIFSGKFKKNVNDNKYKVLEGLLETRGFLTEQTSRPVT